MEMFFLNFPVRGNFPGIAALDKVAQDNKEDASIVKNMSKDGILG
jgi:hypothetical protein